jgi:quercetin dioxygenase-like cupin family protein
MCSLEISQIRLRKKLALTTARHRGASTIEEITMRKSMVLWALCSGWLLTGFAGAQCLPLVERNGDEGCWVTELALPATDSDSLYWHIDHYSTIEAAQAARGPSSVAVEAFESVWLLSVGPAADWRPAGGSRRAQIGPLTVPRNQRVTAVFYLTMADRAERMGAAHAHPGPELFYSIAGDLCVETTEGISSTSTGGVVRVPPETPHALIGLTMRQSIGLLLRPRSSGSNSYTVDWEPSGLCLR